MNLHHEISSLRRLLTLLAVILGLASGMSGAANYNLRFINPGNCPANTIGANAAVGSSCRYTNVVVDAAGNSLPATSIYQRDVIVTLSKLTGGAVVTGTTTNPNAFDNDALQLDGNTTGPTRPEFFTPTVTAPDAANTTAWAEFTFQFVPAGGVSTTTTPLPGTFYMTSFDTDGNGGDLREFIEFVGPSASGVSVNPASADQLGAAVDGGTNYEAITGANQPAIGSGAAYKASAQFATPGIVKFVVGARQGATGCNGACERLSTYSFQVADSVVLYPSVDGSKSVKLTTDADGNGVVSPGDTLTYTVTYTNTGNAAETGFQITDALPAGVTITAAGAQTVRLNGTVAAGARNTGYTGTGVTNLLAAGQNLPVSGSVSVDIPVTVNAVAADNTVLSNQTGSSGSYTNAAGTSLPAPAANSDNVDSTTVFPPSTAATTGFGTVPAGSVAQTQAAGIDPTTVTVRGTPTLSVSKTNNGPWVANQAGATYTLTVSNAGPGATAGLITVRDQLPVGITPRSISGFTSGTFTCTYTDELATGSPAPDQTRAVTCTSSAAIASGSTATITLPVEVNPNAVGAAVNYASVGGGGDPRNGGAAPTPGATCTPAGLCTSNTVTVTDVAPPPVCTAPAQTTNLLSAAYSNYDSVNGQNITRTVPLIANSASYVGQGTGTGKAYVVDMYWGWNNGTGNAVSPKGTISLLINGTVYATMTTNDGYSGYAAFAALNGATIAGSETGRTSGFGAAAPHAYVTLPASVTTISSAQVRWVLGVAPGTSSDDDGGVDIRSINACNLPPTTADVTNAVLLDTAPATVLSPNLSATDTDGTIATYTIVTLPAAASGVLSVNGAAVTAGQTFTAAQLGTLSFDPKAGFNGNATFTYSATDNVGAVSNVSTYTVPVNAAPVAVNDASSTPANTAKTFSVTGNDTDTAPGTVDVASTVFVTSGQPAGSTLSNGNRTITVPNEGVYTLDNSGNVTFTPVAGYSGTTTPVKYTVNDNQGATSNVANITVTVTPVAVNDTATTAPSTLVNIPVLTNDLGTGKVLTSLLFPGGQPVGSSVTNGGKTLTNADGVYTIKTDGTVDFTPALGKTGTLTPVLYTFVDGAGQTSNPATITVTVSTIVPPVATNDSKTTPKNTAVTLEGSTNDTPKSLPIDNTSVVLTAGGTISNAGKTLTNAQGTYQVQANGTVIFTPVSTFAGTTTPVNYTVKDTSGATSNVATLNVTVTNQPPVANNVTNILVTSTAQAAALNPGVSGTDPDGTVVAYTVTTLPTAAQGTLYCNAVALTTVPSTCAPAQLSFKPNPTFDGNATFQYTVTDDNGAVSVAAATYTIPVNKPPVAVNDASSTPANTAKTFSVTGNDTDTAPGTVIVTSTVFTTTGQPTGSTLSNANRTITVPNEGTYTLDNLGNVTFTPVAGYSGTTTPVKYTVNDNQGATSNPANITVTVAVNANLTISKVGPAFFKPGDTLSYTLTVTNTGTAATGVSVTDTLPAGLTFVSASNGGTYDAGTRVVTWTLGNVANGATVTRTLTATAPAAASVETNNGPTSLVNSASVQSDQTPLLASTPTTSQLVYPKLSKRVRNVTQSGAFGTVGTGKPGEVLEYCIDFRNYGVGVAGFVISDSVPSNTNASLSAYGAGLGLQVVRGTTTTRTSTGGDADGGSLSAAALSLDLGTLVAAESGSVCFQASIK